MGCKIPNKTKTSKIISDFFGFLKNVIYICQCGNHPLTVDEKSIYSHNCYDAESERTVKTSGEHEAIYVNYRTNRV